MNWSIKLSGPTTGFDLEGPGVLDGAAGGRKIVRGIHSESYHALYSRNCIVHQLQNDKAINMILTISSKFFFALLTLLSVQAA